MTTVPRAVHARALTAALRAARGTDIPWRETAAAVRRDLGLPPRPTTETAGGRPSAPGPDSPPEGAAT